MAVKIYTASKLHHRGMWLELQVKWSDVEFTARWVTDYADIPDELTFCKLGWQHDVEDVARADLVLAYGTAEETLTGALVESGVALGLGRPVIAVGETKSFGTWQHHPLVFRLPTLEAAKQLVDLFARTGHLEKRP